LSLKYTYDNILAGGSATIDPNPTHLAQFVWYNTSPINLGLILWNQVIPSNMVDPGHMDYALQDSNMYKVKVWIRDYAGNDDDWDIKRIVFRKDWIEPILQEYAFEYSPTIFQTAGNWIDVTITATDTSQGYSRQVVTYDRAVEIDATQLGLPVSSRLTIYPNSPQTSITALGNNMWRIEPQSWASGTCEIEIQDLWAEQVNFALTGKVGGFRSGLPTYPAWMDSAGTIIMEAFR